MFKRKDGGGKSKGKVRNLVGNSKTREIWTWTQHTAGQKGSAFLKNAKPSSQTNDADGSLIGGKDVPVGERNVAKSEKIKQRKNS